MGASAQVLRHATGFLIIGSRQPFQPQATSSSMLAAGLPHGPVVLPALGRIPSSVTIRTPVRRGSPVSHQASDEGETSPDTSIPTARLGGDVPEEGIRVAIVVATQMIATPQ